MSSRVWSGVFLAAVLAAFGCASSGGPSVEDGKEPGGPVVAGIEISDSCVMSMFVRGRDNTRTLACRLQRQLAELSERVEGLSIAELGAGDKAVVDNFAGEVVPIDDLRAVRAGPGVSNVLSVEPIEAQDLADKLAAMRAAVDDALDDGDFDRAQEALFISGLSYEGEVVVSSETRIDGTDEVVVIEERRRVQRSDGRMSLSELEKALAPMRDLLLKQKVRFTEAGELGVSAIESAVATLPSGSWKTLLSRQIAEVKSDREGPLGEWSALEKPYADLIRFFPPQDAEDGDQYFTFTLPDDAPADTYATLRALINEAEVESRALAGRYKPLFRTARWGDFLNTLETLKHQFDGSWEVDERFGFNLSSYGKGRVIMDDRTTATTARNEFSGEVPEGIPGSPNNRLTIHHPSGDPYYYGSIGTTVLDLHAAAPGLSKVPAHGLPFSRTRSFWMEGHKEAVGDRLPQAFGHITVMDNEWRDDRLGVLADTWLGWGSWVRLLRGTGTSSHRVDMGSFVVMSEATFKHPATGASQIDVPAIGPWSACPRVVAAGGACDVSYVKANVDSLVWSGTTQGIYAVEENETKKAGLFRGLAEMQFVSVASEAANPELKLTLSQLDSMDMREGSTLSWGTGGGLPVSTLVYNIGGTPVWREIPDDIKDVAGAGSRPLGSFAGSLANARNEGGVSVVGYAKGTFLASGELRLSSAGTNVDGAIQPAFYRGADHVAGIYNYGSYSPGSRVGLSGAFAASRDR